jgi:predicted PurR-regulated permease PerM
MSERLAIRIVLGLAIVLLTLWVLRELGEVVNRFGSVIALFFCAWLISFVLGPPADALVRLKVRRPLAVFAVYALAFAVIFFGLVLFIPVFADQLGRLREAVNAYTGLTPAMLTWLEERALAFGVTESDLREFYRGALDQVRSITGQALQNAIGLLTGAASVVINLVFCLIISVYMMLDGRRIIAGMLALLPRRYRAEARAVLQSIGDNFGGFIRGTLILSAVYAVGVALTMSLIGLEYKAVSALFAGFALIIPFVGPAISLAPALLVALLTRTGDAWWIALLLFAMQQAVLNVVGPRVYGRTVNMHPLLVIGAALAGAAVAGFWGALFGIPAVGIIASVVKRLFSGPPAEEEVVDADGERQAGAAEPAIAPPAAEVVADEDALAAIDRAGRAD